MPGEQTRRRCKNIRDRIFPFDERPAAVHARSIRERGGPDRTYLDVGCGREGRGVREMAASYGTVIGVDVGALRVVRDLSCVHMITGDAQSLPLASCCVDVVGMANAVEHFARPERVFEECERVLRPGGLVMVLTVNRRFPPIVFGRLLPHGIRQLVNRIATGTSEDETFPAYYAANTARRLAAIGEGAGLVTRSIRLISNHPEYFMFSVMAYRLAVITERAVRRYDSLKGLRHFIHAVFEKPVVGASG